VLNYFFALSQLLEQLSRSNDYFTQNPSSYISNETSFPLLLTTNYTSQPNYNAPAMFQYGGNGVSYP